MTLFSLTMFGFAYQYTLGRSDCFLSLSPNEMTSSFLWYSRNLRPDIVFLPVRFSLSEKSLRLTVSDTLEKYVAFLFEKPSRVHGSNTIVFIEDVNLGVLECLLRCPNSKSLR